jgi:hypothetical protein
MKAQVRGLDLPCPIKRWGRRPGRPRTRCSHCGRYIYRERLLAAVAARYGYSIDSLRSDTRLRGRLAFARAVAAYLLRAEGHTYLSIGAAMRRTDDAIRHYEERVTKLMRSLPHLRELLHSIQTIASRPPQATGFALKKRPIKRSSRK